MVTFEFTSPDGKTYQIEGPDGATQEQAFEILQSQLEQAPRSAPQNTNITDAITPDPNVFKAYSPEYGISPAPKRDLRSYSDLSTPEKYLSGLGSNFYEGLLLGYSDEFGGGVSKALNPNIPYSDLYQKAKETRQGFDTEHGALSTGAEIAGVLSNAYLTKGLGTANYARAHPILGNALGGALYGGVTGTGKGETPTDRIIGGATGFGVGGILGGVTGGIFDVIGKGINRLSSKLSGLDPARKKIAESLQQVDDSTKLLESLKRTNELTGGRGTLADVTPSLQNELGTASRVSPKIYDKGKAVLESRVTDSHAALQRAAQDAFGSKGNATGLLTDLTTKQKELASPLYELAHKEILQIDDNLRDIITNRITPGDWNKAVQIYSRGVKPEERLAVPSIKAIKEGAQSVPLAVIDYLKRFAQSEGFANKNPTVANSYKSLSADISGILRGSSENYAKGSAIFSDAATVKDAALAGKKFLKLTPAEIKSTFESLGSEAERSAFMTGAVSNVDDVIKNIADKSDASRSLIGKAVLREKLGAILPEEQLNRFIETATAYGNFAQTRNAAYAGSQTGDRLASLIGFEKQSPRVKTFIGNLFRGNVGNAFNNIGTGKAYDKNLADNVGALLLQQGPQAEATLKQIINYLPKMNKKQLGFADQVFSNLEGSQFSSAVGEYKDRRDK